MTTINQLRESFKNKELFEQALTHRSWINENPGNRESNERLEFLGDAVLEFVVSSYLYIKLPGKEEGFLTALRANIVNTVNLSKVSKKLSLGEALYLSKGEKNSGGQTNQGLLANTVEAVIGAIFIDQGLDNAQTFIEDNLLSDFEDKLKSPLKDAKSRLQEEVQSQGLPTPKYKVIKESGPDHAKEFEVEVSVNGKVFATGSGKSKNQGEQEAAEHALVKIASKR